MAAVSRGGGDGPAGLGQGGSGGGEPQRSAGGAVKPPTGEGGQRSPSEIAVAVARPEGGHPPRRV